jgi:hypothetical protein
MLIIVVFILLYLFFIAIEFDVFVIMAMLTVKAPLP